jgi:hypothetical protein
MARRQIVSYKYRVLDYSDTAYEPFVCISLFYVRSHRTAACIIMQFKRERNPPDTYNESILSGQTVETRIYPDKRWPLRRSTEYTEDDSYE